MCTEKHDLVAGNPPTGEYAHRLVIDIRDDGVTLGEVNERLDELELDGRIKFVEYDPEAAGVGVQLARPSYSADAERAGGGRPMSASEKEERDRWTEDEILELEQAMSWLSYPGCEGTEANEQVMRIARDLERVGWPKDGRGDDEFLRQLRELREARERKLLRQLREAWERKPAE
jgi:hypothetical protein